MPPLVSVILPTFNRSTYVQEAIRSVLQQTHQPVEVVVVDDGSTDDTPQVMEGIVRDSAGRVVYIRQPNAGASRARNRGLAACRGDFIALLDSDDRWLPHKLELQLPLFDDPSIGMVHGAIRCFDNVTGAILNEYYPGDQVQFHDILAHKHLGTQTLLFRASIARSIGGFDLSSVCAEDWDFMLRMAAKCRVRGVPQTLAEIRIHDAHLSGNKETLAKDSLAVIDRNQKLHQNCPECRQAVRISRAKFRRMLYRDLNYRAREAAAHHHPLTSIHLGLRAIVQDPRAILRFSARLFKRAGIPE